jgi:hypothetical protein
MLSGISCALAYRSPGRQQQSAGRPGRTLSLRELESASLRQAVRAPMMTRHAVTPRSTNYALSVDLKGCDARLQQVGPSSP